MWHQAQMSVTSEQFFSTESRDFSGFCNICNLIPKIQFTSQTSLAFY